MSEPSASFWETLPLGRGFTLLTHDANGLAAFAKPAGGLSHPNTPRDQPRSLLNASYVSEGEYYQFGDASGTTRRLWLLNRLDGATSGVILAAASAELAGEIRQMFQRKQVHKVYNALVFGVPAGSPQTWRDRLVVQKKGGVVRTVVVESCTVHVVPASGKRPCGTSTESAVTVMSPIATTSAN